jgi:hypothetical protein
MKKLIPIAILSLLYQSCIKDRTLRPVPTPVAVKYEDTVRPQILIVESMQGCKLLSSNSASQSVDTAIDDTKFTIYKYSLDGSNYFQKISLLFTSNLPSYRISSTSWMIGRETAIRNGNSVGVDFESPTSELTAKLIIKWRYTNDGVFYTDTISKTFIVSADSSLFGKYYGSSTDDTTNKYIVTIGSMVDSVYDSPRVIWAVKNLLIGYPYQLEILPWSRGFSACSAFGIKEHFAWAGRTFSFPYTFGIQHKNRDSISINYSFYRKDLHTPFYDSVIVKKFVGKKVI